MGCLKLVGGEKWSKEKQISRMKTKQFLTKIKERE